MMRLAVLLVALLALTTPAVAQTPGDGTGGAVACHIRGALPDPACTPGAVLTADRATVCQPGYAAGVRSVPDAEKTAVYAEYGITDHRGYVIDHLIPLEIGGQNVRANLWPEPTDGWPGSHDKDLIEGAVARAVCSGRVSITDAQRWFATDWRTALLEPAGI